MIFPDSMLFLLEQALGKAACNRNWNSSLADTNFNHNSGTVIHSKTL